jgi:hypothetical protein
MVDLFLQDEISYVDKTHQYFNKAGEEYTSVSRLIKSVKVPFDRDGISKRMAESIAAETGVSVAQAQKELLAEWDDKADSSIDKGNYVHDGLEDYAKTGKTWELLEEPVRFMQGIFKQYYRFYPEVLLYSHKYKVAGRTDLVLQRQKSRSPVCDFSDYKSNESKGIQFDSITRKEGLIKHPNRYFLPPFEYLEACNYVEYAFQLSIYAFLALELGNIRVGKLQIIFFDNEFKPHPIPVPFMYHEARILCEMNISRKTLPKVPAVKLPERELDPIKAEMMRRAKYPMRPEECMRKDELIIKDDWD